MLHTDDNDLYIKLYLKSFAKVLVEVVKLVQAEEPGQPKNPSLEHKRKRRNKQ